MGEQLTTQPLHERVAAYYAFSYGKQEQAYFLGDRRIVDYDGAFERIKLPLLHSSEFCLIDGPQKRIHSSDYLTYGPRCEDKFRLLLSELEVDENMVPALVTINRASVMTGDHRIMNLDANGPRFELTLLSKTRFNKDTHDIAMPNGLGKPTCLVVDAKIDGRPIPQLFGIVTSPVQLQNGIKTDHAGVRDVLGLHLTDEERIALMERVKPSVQLIRKLNGFQSYEMRTRIGALLPEFQVRVAQARKR